jgi:DNA topoisomerase VI subunit A
MDPHGFDILCHYTFGNEMLVFEKANIPWIQWLNPYLSVKTVPKTSPMSSRDKHLLENLVNRSYFRQDAPKEWLYWRSLMIQ